MTIFNRWPTAPTRSTSRIVLLIAIAVLYYRPLQAQGDIWYGIVNRLSAKTLDVPTPTCDTQNGCQIQQWDSNGSQQQQWKLVPADLGYYFIMNSLSGKVLDVPTPACDTQNGCTVQQWDLNGAWQQEWQLLPADSGYYFIQNRMSGKVLDIPTPACDAQNGCKLQQWDLNYAQQQQWMFAVMQGNSPTGGVTVTGQESFGTDPYPQSLRVVSYSVIGIPQACQAEGLVYGIGIDVEYQVLDQHGSPLQSSQMIPQEYGTMNGDPFGINNIGPVPGYPDSGQYTAADGTFHDVPVAACANGPFVDSIAQQNISIIFNGQSYFVRHQTFYANSSLADHGNITNNLDISAAW